MTLANLRAAASGYDTELNDEPDEERNSALSTRQALQSNLAFEERKRVVEFVLVRRNTRNR